MAGTSPAMTREKWFNMTGIRSSDALSPLRRGLAAGGIDDAMRYDHNGGAFRRRLVKSQMNWFRTIRGFVRLLVALFVVAQFAGVVSSPRANARPIANAALAHDHHLHSHDHADGNLPHRYDHSENLADTCCALHAYFAGVLPPAVLI